MDDVGKRDSVSPAPWLRSCYQKHTSVWNLFRTPEPKVRLRASMMRTSKRPRAPPQRLKAPAPSHDLGCGSCDGATDSGCGSCDGATDSGCLQQHTRAWDGLWTEVPARHYKGSHKTQAFSVTAVVLAQYCNNVHN
jgi:hypothetical protein